MIISVFHQKDKIGDIPYAALAAFRLFCERRGFLVDWIQKEKKMVLRPGLTGISIALHPDTDSKMNECFFTCVETFLSNSGVTVYDSRSQPPSPEDLYIKFGLETAKVENPHMTIAHHLNRDQKQVNIFLSEELESTFINHEFKKVQRQWDNSFLEISYLIPPNENEEQQAEHLAMHITAALLQYFHNGNDDALLSCLPIGVLDIFTLAADSPKAAVETSSVHHSPPEQETDKPPTHSKKSVVEKKAPTAEIFFDYDVFFSGKKDRLMTYGKLMIKNTSEISLRNPVICLKVEPTGCLEIKGQILPPNMVDGLGVQTQEGAKGWKYLHKDWLDVAEERGEYWIGPIQRMTIPGHQSIELENIQFVIKQPEAEKDVTIQGFVYFNEDQVKFHSNNSIRVNFPKKE